MKKIGTILLLSITSLSINGCSFAMEEAGLFKVGKTSTPQLGTLAYADQELSFEVIKSTALKNCMECHTTGHNAMGTAEQAIALSKTILSEVNSNSMPPKSSGYKTLSDCEKQILETWFDDQAQGRKSVKIKDLPKCQDVAAPPKEEKPDITKLEVTFANLQKYIFAPKCLSCHAHDTEDVVIVLDSVKAMRDEALLADTAEQSLLFKMVSPIEKPPMPPANSGLPKLTADELNFLKTWINNGAKE